MKRLRSFGLLVIFLCVALRQADAQWTPVNIGLSNSYVVALGANSSNLYAGTGGGVFSSITGGYMTWSAANSGLPTVYTVGTFASSGNYLFAGTIGGVYLSTNNGLNWTSINTGLTNTSVNALTGNVANLFAGTYSGVFRSTSAGTSWTTAGLTGTVVRTLAMVGSNLFAGTDGGAYLSTDNGASWTGINNGLTSAPILTLAISGSNIFAAVFGSGVFLSTNNGSSWTAVNTGLWTGVSSLAVSGTNIFAGTQGGGVYLSTNNGTSWTAFNASLTNSDVRSLAVSGTYLFAGTYGGGVFRIPIPLAAPVLLSPANGATGLSTNPTLSWGTSPGATDYWLQVSTDAGFSNIVFNVNGSIPSASYSVTGLVGNMLYYWRVSASNTATTSSYSNVWSFRTVGGVLLAPFLISPSNGATGIPASSTLSWTSSTGATSYELDISTSPTFSNNVLAYITSNTSYLVSGLASNTKYYWCVSASNAGGASPFSSTWNFTTSSALPTQLFLSDDFTATAGVALTSVGWSLSGSSNVNPLTVGMPSLTFSTHPGSGVGGAVSMLNNGQDVYRTFTPINSGSVYCSFLVNISAVDTGDYFIALSPSASQTNYYARLFVKKVGNGFSFGISKSNEASGGARYGTTMFNLNTTYYVVVKYTFAAYPLDPTNDPISVYVFSNGANIATEPQNPEINGYVCVTKSDVDDLSYVTLRQGTATAAPTLVIDAIRVSNGFNVIPVVSAPAAPILAIPSNNATGIATTTALNWNASAGATGYRIQLSTSSSFAVLALDDSTVTGTSRQVGPLANSTLYYWRVNATNAGGTSSYSSVWSFTTMASASVSTPTLVSPTDAAINLPTSTFLIWNASDGATRYHVQISTTPSFTTIVLEDSMVAGTARSVGPLALANTYYWRVRAIGTAGASAFSTIWMFSTIRATGIDATIDEIPKYTSLIQNYPNPFNPTTTIQYNLSKPAEVTLTVYDVLGQAVWKLLSRYQMAGVFKATWDASRVPSGIYFYRLQAGEFIDTKRMILLK